MIQRLTTLTVGILVVIALLIMLAAAPIFVLLWVITGWDSLEWLRRKSNPKMYTRIDELNKETERIKAETEELKRKIAEEESYKANIDRLKREN